MLIKDIKPNNFYIYFSTFIYIKEMEIIKNEVCKLNMAYFYLSKDRQDITHVKPFIVLPKDLIELSVYQKKRVLHFLKKHNSLSMLNKR